MEESFGKRHYVETQKNSVFIIYFAFLIIKLIMKQVNKIENKLKNKFINCNMNKCPAAIHSCS